MKSIIRITFVFSLFYYANANAQSYQSIFGKTTTSWTIEWDNLDINAYSEYFVVRDSIFNERSYKIVFGNDGGTYALVREDTLAGKIWLVVVTPNCSFPDTSEKLVADLSLQLGDTFNISQIDMNVANPGDTFIIVDSVYYDQGQKHIRFVSPDSVSQGYLTEPITFIEGIGPNYSLLWNINQCNVYLDKYLLCAYKDGIKAKYDNLRFNGDCSPVLSSLVNVATDNKVNIYPNPTNNKLYGTLNYPQKSSLQIFAIDGSEVIPSQSIQQSYFELDVSELPAGLYFLVFQNDEERVVRKFVKE